jgi:hypothetical protein
MTLNTVSNDTLRLFCDIGIILLLNFECGYTPFLGRNADASGGAG